MDLETLYMFDALPETDQEFVIALCKALHNRQAGLLGQADRFVLVSAAAFLWDSLPLNKRKMDYC